MIKAFIMLCLYKPEFKDLWFRLALLSDPDTMSYNAKWSGVIDFPSEKWQNWYDRWLMKEESKRFYRHLQNTATNEFVGEVAYHYDPDRNLYICSLIVHAKYRNHGYGTQGLQLLCEAAKQNGITILYDDIAADNPAVGLFLKNGFTVDSQTDDIIIVKRTLAPHPVSPS